jgi:hypothetical protein
VRAAGSNRRGSTAAPATAGDVLGSHVGLLGREAARLQREGGGIAHRPYAVQSAHVAVLVDVNEPLGVGRYAGHRAPVR